jgi:hypothetical protein
MADIFDRYHTANEAVESLPDGPQKENLRSSANHLLHIEQARKVAVCAYQRYCNDMDEWEENILHFIMNELQEQQQNRQMRHVRPPRSNTLSVQSRASAILHL